ncbi:cytochrome P450 [Dendrothele bispora CBS 962.96]|uniref:Cytochrome P450 n=1 Tax=Dendrothele bispora (strain CBS 962.96) TaxID=1314807 RepID=A0A4S8MR08_DENBC|nr:cytochrome P450 [Dendrothele bispora CBS 962.96]
MLHFVVIFLDTCLAVLGVYLLKRLLLESKHKLPPGPKGLPIVGNIFDMPSENAWVTFAKWGEVYGDISSITVFGQTIVVLNSARAAFELLDKKSSIYSDRPVLQMGGELIGWKNTLALMPYASKRFRRYRRLFHNLIGSQATIGQYYPVQELETHRFLRRVLTSSEDLQDHIRKTAGAIIFRISHGYEVKECNDPFVRLADLATEQFSVATAPGQFLVDSIPALRHIPDWFPGAGFKITAKAWASTLLEMVEQPHNFVKQQVASGTAAKSFTSSLLESKQLTDEEEFDLKWSAASLYSGAADTIVSVIYTFFLAMTLYPEVAKKAQAEIDAVVGSDRLPTLADRSYLPYIEALVKEVFRWNVVTPLAVAHRASQDDFHDGYFIPEGAIILPNIWKMTHDEQTYSDPMEFKPERFLANDGRKVETDPRETVFGFGRRICPGMHLADASAFISCAMSLAVFDITKCLEHGAVIEPVNERTNGTISHPKPFRCSIRPRSQKAAALIQADD